MASRHEELGERPGTDAPFGAPRRDSCADTLTSDSCSPEPREHELLVSKPPAAGSL